jgi:mono/diheme cytochrome c family protein
MRERLARALAALSTALILLAVLGFAAYQNRPDGTDAATPDPAAVAAGRAVYDAQGCALCHAIAGEGDRSYPLDGIGRRMNHEQLRQHIAPPESMRAKFPDAVFEMKQSYQSLPAAEMEHLVAYLRSLR